MHSEIARMNRLDCANCTVLLLEAPVSRGGVCLVCSGWPFPHSPRKEKKTCSLKCFPWWYGNYMCWDHCEAEFITLGGNLTRSSITARDSTYLVCVCVCLLTDHPFFLLWPGHPVLLHLRSFICKAGMWTASSWSYETQIIGCSVKIPWLCPQPAFPLGARLHWLKNILYFPL